MLYNTHMHIPVAKFRKNIKDYLKQLPIVLTVYGRDVAKVVELDEQEQEE